VFKVGLQFAICNLQFAICNLQFAICNFILIFDFDLISLFRPISTRLLFPQFKDVAM
jgi:hypothetical protein